MNMKVIGYQATTHRVLRQAITDVVGEALYKGALSIRVEWREIPPTFGVVVEVTTDVEAYHCQTFVEWAERRLRGLGEVTIDGVRQ